MRFDVALACLLLAGCTTALDWQDAPHNEDPDPSGPAYLQAYKETHYEHIGHALVRDASTGEVLQRAGQARVVFLGDHHDDRGLHRFYRDLLAQMAEQAPLALGLECVGAEDQPVIDDYLASRIDLATLRLRLALRWPGSWLEHPDLDSAFYRDLLRFARERHLPVFALEPVPRLELDRRDAVIADHVRAAATRWPGAHIVVVVGHTHLLGDERVVERVALPDVVLLPRLSVSLSGQLDAHPPRDGRPLLVTDTGAYVVRPAARRGDITASR